jgi:hypothetical protein
LTGERPGDVFREFRDHISGVLNKTITDARLSLIHRKSKPQFAQFAFAFRDEREIAMAAPLFGCNLFLALSQQLEAEQEAEKTWRLRTLEYSYHLLEEPNPDSRWIIKLDFDKLHLSTGWVTVEEVVRFLITEIGVKPKRSDWNEILIESEELFKAWTGRTI